MERAATLFGVFSIFILLAAHEGSRGVFVSVTNVESE